MRDSQRGRLYRAEKLAQSVYDPEVERTLSDEECRKLVAHVIKLRTKRHAGRPMEVKVNLRRGYCSARATHSWRTGRAITLPQWARRRVIILHEVAHHLSSFQHGPRFAKCFLELVRTFIGPAEGAILRQAYKEERVRYRVAG
jgi:putative metallohydrolase (TIGR04338 family)